MKRTFIDTGVLIAAARGQNDVAVRAMAILDDPNREFASSIFVKLEVLLSEVHRQIPDFSKKSGILLRDCTSST
jgi:hypothetical protein